MTPVQRSFLAILITLLLLVVIALVLWYLFLPVMSMPAGSFLWALALLAYVAFGIVIYRLVRRRM